DKEDYRRRVKWGEAAGKACDALCVSGEHLRDWTPHRVAVEPVSQAAMLGEEITLRITLGEFDRNDPGATVVLRGRGRFPDQTVTFTGGQQTKIVKVKLGLNIPAGRNVFAVETKDKSGVEFADPYFALEVSGR